MGFTVSGLRDVGFHCRFPLVGFRVLGGAFPYFVGRSRFSMCSPWACMVAGFGDIVPWQIFPGGCFGGLGFGLCDLVFQGFLMWV